ncbi:hypothetical protein R1flu_010899 [Riccia fluitans]|uniref:Acid phosphatase n=1 Tax=Riccia fluitans TaxID=41844 RepID=A0ABD1Z9E1_9MARC
MSAPSSSVTNTGPHEATVTLLNKGGSGDSTSQHESSVSSSSLPVKVLVSASFIIGFLLSLAVTEFAKTGSYPRQSIAARYDYGLNPYEGLTGCDESFIMNAEVNNLPGFKISPECKYQLAGYMEHGAGIDFVGGMAGASDYLKTLEIRGDGLDVVVIGVDDTALSNLDFFRNHSYGGDEYSEAVWNEWIYKKGGKSHPKLLELYNQITDAKVGVIFLSWRPESQRDVTAENLISEGYNRGWEDLILRSSEENALTNGEFKSQRRAELMVKGYRILFTVGDQWSDFSGPAKSRFFKVPNPMYYRY